MPDWSKLKPYKEDKRRSFEELCYQLADRLYGTKGRLTRVDDSGGGDGVEYYLTRPDGTEWGWQAKFFPQPARLNVSGRKSQITSSLERSLEKHPRLRRWFLCIPSNFTPKEQEWFDTALRDLASTVELVIWGDSTIESLLNNPQCTGIKLNFFGELEFTSSWFRDQVAAQLKGLRDKFNPLLHTEGSSDLKLHAMMGDDTFLDHLGERLRLYDSYLPECQTRRDSALNHNTLDHWKESYRRLTLLIETFYQHVESGHTLQLEFLEKIREGRPSKVSPIRIMEKIESAHSIAQEFSTESRHFAVEASKSRPVQPKKENRTLKDPLDDALETASAPFNCGADLVDVLAEAHFYLVDYVSHTCHFLGEAAVGKTHLTCNVCHERVVGGLPAILLLGANFPSDCDVKQRIKEACDIPARYSFEDFLSALDSYTFSTRTKALIAIDGLNESQSPRLWKLQLAALEYLIEQHDHLALVTTCRVSYVPAIWGDHYPLRSTIHDGFTSDNVHEAIEKYFAYYRLRATLTLASISQFEQPLYLKIYCESQNPERTHEKEVHIGEQSFPDVFDQYLTRVNARVCEKLSKAPSARVVQKSLIRFARHLWDSNKRYVTFDDAVQVLDGKASGDVNWDSSLTKALLDESLLIARNWARVLEEEHVFFTYDFLGGYLITRACLEGLDPREVKRFYNSLTFGDRLLGENYEKLHRHHEDILRCMAVILPQKVGIYLHSRSDNNTAFSAGVRALFEMAPEFVREKDRAVLRALFDGTEHGKRLMVLARTTAFNSQHPLNWYFWDSLLETLSVPERDESWTEYLRENATEMLALAQECERKCDSAENLGNVERERLHLAARYCRWLLTSTNHLLRDTATKALYWYGRRFPEQLFSLTLRSLRLNDPYVPERMLAASYGVAMALHMVDRRKHFGQRILPDYAKALYNAMFTRGAKSATRHALMRDYAKHTIDIALLHHPRLLKSSQRTRLEPPYRDGGIRTLRKGRDRNPSQYRDGNFPLGMDFHNYTLSSLSPDRKNYDFKDPHFKKVVAHVWWRIYNLGYSLERFGEIDKQIARSNWHHGRSGDNATRIDRYGKKYAWIAFYELYGLFQDRGVLASNWPAYDARPSDVDIEPSFPNPPHPLKIVDESFLEPKTMAPTSWVKQGPVPKLLPYLVLPELDGETGPWVLLDGGVAQEDENIGHRIQTHTTALLVKSELLEKLVKLSCISNLGGYWLPRAPSSHYSFVGEIPWCESIPKNGLQTLEFITEIRRRMETPDEVNERLKWSTIGIKMSLGDVPSWPATDKRDRKELRKPQMKEVTIMEQIEVLMPIHHMGWESYHTAITKCQGHVVARDIAEPLGLCAGLPSMDLYDRDGRRAAITVAWSDDDSWTNHQTAVYLRQDLFDRFMRNNNLGCVWGVWGERNYPVQRFEELAPKGTEGPHWTQFSDVYLYEDGNALHVGKPGGNLNRKGGQESRKTKLARKKRNARATRKGKG